MSGRIEKALREAPGNGKGGFIPFITAGDPDDATTVDLILMLAAAGATVIELGVPFTDPMADGPVIQRSSQRVLESGRGSIGSILEIVRRVRRTTDVPIVLFGYLNPFISYGIDKLANAARDAGVDGFLVTDVIDREFSELSARLEKKELDLISLVAPTTTDARLEVIAKSARGFVYAVSRTGVTGRGADFRDSAEELVKRIRRFSKLPVAVGFGINTKEQVESVWRYADAAVVGSAIVSVIEEGPDGAAAVSEAERFVRELLA